MLSNRPLNEPYETTLSPHIGAKFVPGGQRIVSVPAKEATLPTLSRSLPVVVLASRINCP